MLKVLKTISYIAVDSNGTQNESVVQDISFDAGGASGNVILTPARGLMTYTSNGTAWTYQSTTVRILRKTINNIIALGVTQ